MRAIALMALLGATSAIRFTELVDDETIELNQKIDAMNAENKKLLQDFTDKIELSERNTQNGGMGKMYTQGQIESIKSLAQKLTDNLSSESEQLNQVLVKLDAKELHAPEAHSTQMDQFKWTFN